MVIKSSGPLKSTQSKMWLWMCFAVSVKFFMAIKVIQMLCLIPAHLNYSTKISLIVTLLLPNQSFD